MTIVASVTLATALLFMSFSLISYSRPYLYLLVSDPVPLNRSVNASRDLPRYLSSFSLYLTLVLFQSNPFALRARSPSRVFGPPVPPYNLDHYSYRVRNHATRPTPASYTTQRNNYHKENNAGNLTPHCVGVYEYACQQLYNHAALTIRGYKHILPSPKRCITSLLHPHPGLHPLYLIHSHPPREQCLFTSPTIRSHRTDPFHKRGT